MVFQWVKNAYGELQRRADHADQTNTRQQVMRAYAGEAGMKKIIRSPVGVAAWWFDENGLLFSPDDPFYGADDVYKKNPDTGKSIFRHIFQKEKVENPFKEDLSAYGLEGFQAVTLKGPKGHEHERYIAWYKEAEPGQKTIAYCHGVGGPLDSRRELFKQIAGKGLGLIVVAYPGFKGSKKDAHGNKQNCSQPGCLRAAMAMVRALEQPDHTIIDFPEHSPAPVKEVPTGDIILFGESLGVSVALHTLRDMERGVKRFNNKNPKQAWQESGEKNLPLWDRMMHTAKESRHHTRSDPYTYIREPRKPMALVGFGGFTTMKDAVRADPSRHLLPTDEMKNPFRSIDIIGRARSKILLLHGTADTTVPFIQGKRLAAAAQRGGADITFVPLEGTNHWLAPLGTMGQALPNGEKPPNHIDNVANMDPEQVGVLIDDIIKYLGLDPKLVGGGDPKPLLPDPGSGGGPERNGDGSHEHNGNGWHGRNGDGSHERNGVAHKRFTDLAPHHSNGNGNGADHANGKSNGKPATERVTPRSGDSGPDF